MGGAYLRRLISSADHESSTGPTRRRPAPGRMAAMVPPRKLLMTLAVAGLATAAAVPTAGAAKAPKITAKYTFLVSVKGTQKTTWTHDHIGQGSCDADQHGAGKQTIKFHSAPKKMHTFDGLSQPYFFRKGGTGGMLSLALKGKVTRNGSITT